MQVSSSQFHSVALLIHDENSANLKVHGLTILERNKKHLQDLGWSFDVVKDQSIDDLSAKYDWVLRGDFQCSLRFFSQLKKTTNESVSKNGMLLHERQTTSNQDVTDVPVLRKSLSDKEVVDVLQKKFFSEIHAQTEGVVAKHINKKVSFFVTQFLVRTPITPNQITFLTFLIGLAGCLFLLSSQYAHRILGAFLIQLNSILDGSDGEVARLKVKRSKLGAWLDTISDDVLNNFMFVCLYLGFFSEFPSPKLYGWCVATTFASLGVSFFIYHYLIKHKKQNAADFRLSWTLNQKTVQDAASRQSSVHGSAMNRYGSWFDVFKVFFKRDFFIFLAFILLLLDLRFTLIILFFPAWIVFFLYLVSFIYGYVKPVNWKVAPNES